MKRFSIQELSKIVIKKRKERKITQVQLADLTGINRGMISRLESCDYTPSLDQLQSLAEVLNFEPVDLFISDNQNDKKKILNKKYNRKLFLK